MIHRLRTVRTKDIPNQSCNNSLPNRVFTLHMLTANISVITIDTVRSSGTIMGNPGCVLRDASTARVQMQEGSDMAIGNQLTFQMCAVEF